MLLLRGRRAGFNVNGLMLACWKHSGEQKGQHSSVRDECVSCGFRYGWPWERAWFGRCMASSLYSSSKFWINYMTLWEQQLILHLTLGRAHTTGTGRAWTCVCSSGVWLRLCPWGGGNCKALGAPGKSWLLQGLLLQVLAELVQLLKEDTALAFSSLGSLAQESGGSGGG